MSQATWLFFKPHLTIHLGDVYYAGTGDQEQHQFVNLWPKGSIGSLALNSNHEMYSGANPYFKAIAGSPFGLQNGCSYFALENNNWVIVGLDSAYFSPEDGLYMDGSLGPPGGGTQVMFLQGAGSKGQEGHRADPSQWLVGGRSEHNQFVASGDERLRGRCWPNTLVLGPRACGSGI